MSLLNLLSRDAILAAQDIPTQDVAVPEWGGTVRLRALTGAERDEFEAASITGSGKKRTVNMENMRARLVARSAVDEAGQRMFSDSDVKALGTKSAAALDRLFTAASRLSGLSDDDVDRLAEGFGNAQNEDSDSD